MHEKSCAFFNKNSSKKLKFSDSGNYLKPPRYVGWTWIVFEGVQGISWNVAVGKRGLSSLPPSHSPLILSRIDVPDCVFFANKGGN